MKDKIIKIQHIITSLSRGGAEAILYNLVKSLPVDSGFKHSVINLTGENAFDFASMGVQVENLAMQRGMPSLRARKLLRQHMHAFAPDLIQGWMYHGNIAASLAALKSIPIVYGVHHSLHRLRDEKLLTQLLVYMGARFACRNVSHVVFCSQKSKTQHESMGYPSVKSAFIPNGIDCKRFKPARNGKYEARRLAGLGLPENALLLGHVARFHPMKNHVGLIRSFAEVTKRQPQAHLVMIGRNVTPENSKLQKALDTAGLNGKVFLLGERDDIEDIMPAFDVYLSASLGEAFPIVLGEAMSCGVPCIATDVGDSASLIGDTGRIVPPGNEIALTKAIEEMLLMPAYARQELGIAARKRVLKEFSLPSMAEDYAGIYRESVCFFSDHDKQTRNS